MDTHYDVIIIGGRIAGSALAAHLGRHKLRVLVVDKQTFPSTPGVPSSPILYDGHMQLLDELGIPESAYAKLSARVDRIVIQVRDYFQSSFVVSELAKGHLKHDQCVYSFERAEFDHLLWENLAQYPSVTVREDFNVTSLIKNEQGKISGVVGYQDKQQPETFTADLVVGADGRFSRTAHLVGAKTTHEVTDIASSVYFAAWENVLPFDDEYQNTTAHIFTNIRGKNILTFPLTGGRSLVTLYIRHGREAEKGERSIEEYYLDELKRQPEVWDKMKNARQVSPMIGMKQIGNGYREAGGEGWALVGDAIHYKDPLDGQGIHDALLSAKMLAESIYNWKCAGLPWEQALKQYETRFMDASMPMFKETVARLKRELYDEPPFFIAKTVMRWLLQSPAYKQRFLLVVSRAVDPTNWLTGSLVLQSIRRGLWRDLTRQQG